MYYLVPMLIVWRLVLAIRCRAQFRGPLQDLLLASVMRYPEIPDAVPTTATGGSSSGNGNGGAWPRPGLSLSLSQYLSLFFSLSISRRRKEEGV